MDERLGGDPCGRPSLRKKGTENMNVSKTDDHKGPHPHLAPLPSLLKTGIKTKMKRYLQFGWAILLSGLLLSIIVTPAGAAQRSIQSVAHTHDTTNVNATIYLPQATLQPIFQGSINQQVPTAVNNAIASIVGTLPAADRGWAQQMATSLFQPSATLVSLVPQQGGLAMTLRMSLYNGDPQPITAQMLITFSVLDSSTVQISAKPMSGSPTLVSGPIATFHIPIGQMDSITATPTCGDSALAVNLQFPLTLGSASTQAQQSHGMLATVRQPAITHTTSIANDGVSSYVELPANSLAALGNGVGTLPISSSLSAQNIRVSVQGSNLIVNSDIMWGTFRLGVATTTFAPTASNGDLALQIVGKTQLTWANIFQFPFGTYDPQIQQMINSKLSNALTGKFYVTNAAIGPDSHVPCAASDSLILTGTTSLV